MKPFLALVFSLALLFCGCGPEPATTVPETLPIPEQAAAVAEIEKFEGEVTLNASGEVIEVRLSNTKITDARLEHLKGLTSLNQLVLNGTQITNAGLEHLKGLTSLTNLGLEDTQVTDAGLEHLKDLNSLNTLHLSQAQITGAGLEHLKGLTSLNELNLTDTQITDAGLSELKAALPKCDVYKF
jgi:hypothetical protein